MSRPAIHDFIVPGSLRTVTTTWERSVITVRCGRCASEFDADAGAKTTHCKSCGRNCRLNQAAEAGPDVIPLRRVIEHGRLTTVTAPGGVA